MIERDLYAIELYANGVRLLRARRMAGLPCRIHDRHEALVEAVEGALTARVGSLPLAPIVFFLLFAVAVVSIGVARP
jgi:hypothetical protein